VLYGSFGLQIIAGEVTVCGAFLRPTEDVAWLHAPLSHALPVIRTMSQTTLRVLPHPSKSGLWQLESLSRLFGKLWNTGDASAGFEIVC
jgi:polynucleotide 5'-hydroxyl-kinase GRC3/NOL9